MNNIDFDFFISLHVVSLLGKWIILSRSLRTCLRNEYCCHYYHPSIQDISYSMSHLCWWNHVSRIVDHICESLWNTNASMMSLLFIHFLAINFHQIFPGTDNVVYTGINHPRWWVTVWGNWLPMALNEWSVHLLLKFKDMGTEKNLNDYDFVKGSRQTTLIGQTESAKTIFVFQSVTLEI